MSDKLYRHFDWLWRQYVELNKTLREVAAEGGTTGATISAWLGHFRIARRSPGRPGPVLQRPRPRPEIEPGWRWLIENGFRHRVPANIIEEYKIATGRM